MLILNVIKNGVNCLINTNLNATIRINYVDLNKKSLYADFSSSEKCEMIASLQFIGSDFQTFILSFYKAFLEKKTLKFVQKETEESLINMVSASLNLIITCIENPIPLADYIDILVATHPKFPELVKDTELFAKAFMKSLIDTFKENYNERLGILWFKAVSTFAISVDFLLKNM